MTSVPTAPGAPARIRPAPSVTAVPYSHSGVRRLTQALRAEQLGLYGFADDPDATPEADFDPPVGLFLIAHVGDKAVGCGGVRLLDEHTAEIKRMYVAPEARGAGAGQAILRALEDAAQRWGVRQILLETGARNHAALALYDRAGYVRIESYVTGRDPQINRALSKTFQGR